MSYVTNLEWNADLIAHLHKAEFIFVVREINAMDVDDQARLLGGIIQDLQSKDAKFALAAARAYEGLNVSLRTQEHKVIIRNAYLYWRNQGNQHLANTNSGEWRVVIIFTQLQKLMSLRGGELTNVSITHSM